MEDHIDATTQNKFKSQDGSLVNYWNNTDYSQRDRRVGRTGSRKFFSVACWLIRRVRT